MVLEGARPWGGGRSEFADGGEKDGFEELRAKNVISFKVVFWEMFE